jgi:hypothetical protein
MKRTVLAIAAAAALAIAAVPSTASAQHWGGHWGHFGGHHFGFGGPRVAFGFGVAPAPYYDYDDYYACRVHRVWTPYGWRWRRWC